MKNVFKNIKKYNWIFLILYLILILYIKWNANEILDIVFLSILEYFKISLFILIHFIYSIVLIIKNIKDNIYKIPNILLLIITFTVLIFSLFINIDNFKINYEFKKYKQERLTIINQIYNNEVEYKNNNYITLPKKYEKLSVDGDVYLYNNNEDIAIGFTYLEMFGKIGQVVYYEGKEEDLLNAIDKDISSVEIIEKNWYYIVTINVL